MLFADEDVFRPALCPVRSLKRYWEWLSNGLKVLLVLLAHWVREVIGQAYLNACEERCSSNKCHSVCTMATSSAALRAVSLADICEGAAWNTRFNFTRFCLISTYRLRGEFE